MVAKIVFSTSFVRNWLRRSIRRLRSSRIPALLSKKYLSLGVILIPFPTLSQDSGRGNYGRSISLEDDCETVEVKNRFPKKVSRQVLANFGNELQMIVQIEWQCPWRSLLIAVMTAQLEVSQTTAMINMCRMSVRLYALSVNTKSHSLEGKKNLTMRD